MIPLAPALCSVTFRSLPPEAVADLAAEAGLAAIEWGGDVHLPPGDLRRARAVRALTESRGLKVASYGSYLRPPSDPPGAVSAVLATARALGASVRVWAGPRGRGSADTGPADREAVVAALRGMAGEAERAGARLGLEYHPSTLTDDLASARSLLASVGHPNLYTYWQPRPGLPLATALAEIDALAPDLSHLHVFAWDEKGRRHPLADHADYWRRVFDAVRDSRWRGPRYAMIEFVRDDSVEAFREDAATLKDLLGRGAGPVTP